MPRTKPTNNPFGTILKKQITKHGRKVFVWDARKRYTGADGKKKVKFKRCYTAGEAQIALTNFQTEIKKEIAEAATEKIHERTFAELADYYEKEFVKPAVFSQSGRKIAGFKSDLAPIRTNIKTLTDYFGDMILREIKYEDIRRFAEKFAQTKTRRENLPAVSTINAILSRLRHIFTAAIQNDWLDVSPLKKGKSLIDKAGEFSRNRMLTFDEERRLLKACEPGYRNYSVKRKKEDYARKFSEPEKQWTQRQFVDRSHLIPLIICALDTAMRAGEIFNLEWWQIDLENRVIYLTEEAAQNTKTGEEGILPITDRLYEILADAAAGKSPYRCFPKHYDFENDKVFSRFDYKRAFSSACTEAGIENLQLRDFRSTGATRMVLAGNAESQVMKITRHRQLKIFLQHYTNVNTQNAQRIGDKLNAFLNAENAKITENNNAKVKEKVNAGSEKTPFTR